MWPTIERKVLSGERLSPAEGVHLLSEAPLLELGSLAHEVRARKTDPKLVTYVIDTNPNYTNVCTVDCHFCAFYRKPGGGSPDAYTHDLEGVMKMMAAADRLGATTVLLQGGLNPAIPWEFYPAIVRESRRRYPHITPHFFSAPEIHQMVEVSGLEIVEHFDYIRSLQDETHGFTAFVPWSYKRGNTPMEQKVKQVAGASRYLRVLAASRLYLDNFDHVQATWFSEGKKTGQIALHFGADDFGGTLYEENVHLATGHLNKATVAELETLIREAGFTPAQRTTLYEILRVAPGPESTAALPADVPLFVESLRELPPEYPEALEGEESPARADRPDQLILPS